MPIYGYICTCGWHGDMMREIDQRDNAVCPNCRRCPERQMAAPIVRLAGVTPRGGGADRFTAEMLGVRPDDLPLALRTPQHLCEPQS